MIKLLDVLKDVLKEATDFTVGGYSADGDSKKDQAAAGYSARSTGGTTIDRTPRKNFDLGKGKGHEGWFDDEIKFDQELKSIVDRYHARAAKMKALGTSTRADIRGGKQGWQERNYIVKLPTGSWEEFKTDKRNLVNAIRKIIVKFVEQVTGPDYTGRAFEDLNDEEFKSWLKSFKVNSKDETLRMTIPLKAKEPIEKLLKGLYPTAGKGERGVQRSLYFGPEHEYIARKATSQKQQQRQGRGHGSITAADREAMRARDMEARAQEMTAKKAAAEKEAGK